MHVIRMIKALATLTLGSLLVSAQYHIMCFEDSECEGFCMEGTCWPYIAQGQFCNLYRKCTSNSVCVDNSCIDNSTSTFLQYIILLVAMPPACPLCCCFLACSVRRGPPLR